MNENLKQVSVIHSGVAAFIANTMTIVFFPFETLRTRFQVYDGFSQNQIQRYSSSLKAVKTIAQKEGVWALYRGCYMNLFGSFANFIYFSAYQNCKNFHHNLKDEYPETFKFLTSSEAAAFSTLFSTPLWTIKTRIQLQGYKEDSPIHSIYQCCSKTIKVEGVRGFCRGMLPSMVLASHGVVLMYSYETLKEMDWFSSPVNGGLSKLLASSSLFPVHTIRTRQ